MKTTSFHRTIRGALAIMSLAWCHTLPLAAQSASPVISSIATEGTNLVVAVQVPANVRRVTLEGRVHFGRGTLEPRAVARLDCTRGEIKFRLAPSGQVELMRVPADTTEP